jgi:radical SAM protein with 4Fe4S-binding SPASM domain
VSSVKEIATETAVEFAERVRIAPGLPSDFDPDLAWVDGFVREIRDHIFIRAVDSLLIVLPNQTYKLNDSAIALMTELVKGRGLRAVLGGKLDRRDVRLDLFYFFLDLKAIVAGELRDVDNRMAIERIRYEPPINALPVLSEIAVTYACNLRCAFCYAGSCPERRETMTLAQCRRVLDVIRRDAQVPSVSFTGGEPTLVEWLPDAVRYAKKLKMRVNLITNGTLLTDSLVSRLKSAGLDSAQVSLEAPTPATHDRITTVQGSFERTVRGVKLLKDAGIHVHCNTTVNRLNLPELDKFTELYRELGLTRFSMNLMIPCGHGAGARDLWVKYEETCDIVRRMRRLARDAGLKFMWYSPTPMCMFNPIPLGLGNKSCAACDGLLSIAPDGGVLPCSSWDEPVGNVLREPFARVWDSARARFIRGKEYAPSACAGCELLAICQAACPLYWDAVGTTELTTVHGK